MSRLLFLSRWFPDPPNNGSKLRIYHLLQGLATRYDVTLLTFFDPHEPRPRGRSLSHFCSRVETVPWKAYNPHSSRALLGLFSPRPRFVIDTFSSEMNTAIRDLLSSGAYDAVIASQLDMAIYSEAFGSVPALFEEVEVATLYEQYAQASTPATRLRYRFTWFKHRRYLQQVLNNLDACTVVSRQEKQLLARAAPDYRSVAVIPNCVDATAYDGVRAAREENTLVFSGSLTYDPNYEAMIWFLQHVFPHVQRVIPGAKLVITGNHGGRRLPRSRDVTLTGFVDDVRPLIAGASISLAPIFTGGGTRLKILEAMALGTPVVATHKGAEGLQLTAGKHLLLADEPAEFAQAIVRILRDRELAQGLAANARSQVQQHYDWSAVMPRFLDLIESVKAREKTPAWLH